MAVTVNIYYKGENGSAKKFANEMIEKGIVDRIKAKEGNLRYEYFIPLNDNETVLLIDAWKNQEEIDIHHDSDIMKEIIFLRDKYDLHMTVERYIEDEENRDIDKNFIRK